MFKYGRNLLNIEKDSKFAQRIVFLSIPTALVFILLVAIQLMTPIMAIVSYASIIVFNILLLFPMTFEMQQLKNYISTLASGENFDEKAMSTRSMPCTVSGRTKPMFWKRRPFPIPRFWIPFPTRS